MSEAAAIPVRTPGARLEPLDESGQDFTAYVGRDDRGLATLHLLVEGAHCGACVQRIERALLARPEVETARLNLTTRRLAFSWRGGTAEAGALVQAVTALGYRVVPYDPERLQHLDAQGEQELLRALAVAGFAAANVMLLSVAIWAGHYQNMSATTRDLLHWFSALIALPAIAYAGRPFFRSAAQALAKARMNMDLPISLAVVLAAGMSLFETLQGGEHAYFDSAVTLLFFLLIGRYLDARARGRARSAAERLVALGAKAVTLLDRNGAPRAVKPEQVRQGMTVLVAPGERVAVDGRVSLGRSELDTSLITGESLPASVAPGDQVFAGTLNLAAPLQLSVTAVGEDTLLAEIVRLMELAEQRRGRFVAIADRVARAYAPAVHILALATLLGWLIFSAAPWQTALLHAIAVLIVTCPCALGLAVPAVQVIAAGRLMRRGILLKSASALERLAGIDMVVFDKTGTLTLGRPELTERPAEDEALRLAASMAGASRHPLAQALARAAPAVPVVQGVEERPGEGLILHGAEGETRLGRLGFVVPGGAKQDAGATGAGAELWLGRPGRKPLRFGFRDRLRPDAGVTLQDLHDRGLELALLSGDRPSVVAALAKELGIDQWQAAMSPKDKVAALESLKAQGRRVLMVGDGLNDAPALAAAFASLSPASAADISRTAADAIFQGEALAPVVELIDTARRAERLVRQNFGLAFGYNVFAVPLAIAGLVTPLVAALCMSASSLAVVGNALRLSRAGRS